MSQRLTIHQFGPIADIDIDVNDILVFIGSQASGKSTVSKAIFFFKSLKDDLYRYYLDCYNQNKFNDPIFGFYKLIKQKFIKIYGYTVQPHNTKITYRYNDEIEISIEASENGGIGYPIFSNELIINFFKIINKLEVLHHDLNQNASIFSSSREISTIKSKETALFEDISNQLNNIFGDEREVIYLPAGRSLITTLSQQRYNIDMGDNLLSDGKLRSDNLIKLDYLMREFILL
ncbi:MAG: AAA family ATPase [Pseudanabaena sp. ELA645]